MDNVVLVEIVDCFQDLANGLRCIFFRESALFTDSVKQLSSGGQLGDDVVLVLRGEIVSSRPCEDMEWVSKPTLDSNQS